MVNNTSIRQLNIREGYGLLEKCNYQTQMHRHFPIEMIYCRNGFFDIGTKQSNHTSIKSVLIPSGLPHSFKCTDAKCELLFIDPLSQSGQFFIETYQLEAQTDVVLNLHEAEAIFDGNALEKIYSEKHCKRNERIDPRIHHCIDAISTNVNVDLPDLTIKQLSRISCLSEGRLSHLFKEQTGISIRQYILWKKVCLAASEVMAGQSLTSAAHYAGFFDSAHFHRVFSNMFGVNPFLGLKD